MTRHYFNRAKPYQFMCDGDEIYNLEKIAVFYVYDSESKACTLIKHGDPDIVEKAHRMHGLMIERAPAVFEHLERHLIEVETDDLEVLNRIINTSLLGKEHFDKLSLAPAIDMESTWVREDTSPSLG